ncbi:hypothetical protein ACJX0J_034341, partial [Zea mays]
IKDHVLLLGHKELEKQYIILYDNNSQLSTTRDVVKNDGLGHRKDAKTNGGKERSIL